MSSAVCQEHDLTFHPKQGCPECVRIHSEQYDKRPVQDPKTGKWDALDGSGYGHVLGYATEELCQAWIDGYDSGAAENM